MPFIRSSALVVPAYILMCAIWGTTWLAIKVSLQGLPPVTGAGVRFIVAGLFLGALGAARTRTAPAAPRSLLLTLALCMFGGNYTLTYLAETRLASGLVAVLFGSLPFFVFALGAVLLGERVGARAIAGASLAFAGVAAISLAGGGDAPWPYVLATLGAAALSAYANVALKAHADTDPLHTLPPAMLIAGLAMTVGGSVFEHVDWHAAVAPGSIAAVAYLAIFGSGIAFSLNHWLLRRMSTWVVGLSALIIPVIAVIVGVAAGGEHVNLRELAGAALVLGGVWIALAAPQKVPLAP